jgi:hypothetical protein
MKQIVLILFILIFSHTHLFAQETLQSPNSLKFFLECWDCDFNFVRQELNFVTFVRDPKQADVHILSTESRTGSGGRKYFLNFYGMHNLEGQDAEYEYLAMPSVTDDQVRRGLLKVIQLGILHYYHKTGLLNQISVELKENSERKTEIVSDDPWNLWIFTINAGSDFEKEASQNGYTLDSEIEIEKTTSAWKTEMEARYEVEHENYFDDDKKISDEQNEITIRGNYIKSLSPRWSAGIFGGYYLQTYLNTRNSFQADAGVEYNIFPWDISNRKVFTFRYEAGLRYYDYNEITIYDKVKETLYFHAISLNLDLVQPWGNIETRIEGRHYFHDFSKNRLTFDSRLSVRLTRQFSVYAGFEADVIHDQLYLPKGDTSLEDLLLRRRKLATTYEISGRFGFQFTFGSIYNNVVNERF